MQEQLRLVVGLAVVAFAAGCATNPVITHVKSEPPGARIEVNSNYVGTTPLDLTLPQKDSHKLKGRVVLRALPIQPGQYVQEKVLFWNQPAPENVLFDMSLQTSTSK